MDPSAPSIGPDPGPGSSPVFVTTRWSVVLSARAGDSPESSRALEDLCRAYWYPLYAHVRRLGHAPADAEDLTQAFFARLLEKRWLAAADQDRGRFRSFLLGSLKHFLANERDRARAQKRGGHVRIVPLDPASGESWLQHEPASTRTPDREFDRRWALALLETVLARLEQEYTAHGKAPLFHLLKGTLGAAPAATPAAQLAMSEGAMRVAAHRLRRRYRDLLRDEIAQTVATPAEVEAELRHLLAALAP